MTDEVVCADAVRALADVLKSAFNTAEASYGTSQITSVSLHLLPCLAVAGGGVLLCGPCIVACVVLRALYACMFAPAAVWWLHLDADGSGAPCPFADAHAAGKHQSRSAHVGM